MLGIILTFNRDQSVPTVMVQILDICLHQLVIARRGLCLIHGAVVSRNIHSEVVLVLKDRPADFHTPYINVMSVPLYAG